MRSSFALRLGVAFAGVGFLAAALTALLVNVAFGSRFSEYLEDRRELRQRQVVATLADSYRARGGWDPAELNDLASLVLMDGGTLRIEDPRGRTIWDGSEAISHHMSEVHREMMGSGPLGPERRLPVRSAGSVVGIAAVRLPQPGLLAQDRAFRSSVNRLLIFGGIGAGLSALALGLFLARRATAPARALTRAARSLASGDRDVRLASGRPDEFGTMARAFDSMADAVAEEDRLRRSFASSVAHELRTPLSILRSQVEAIQDGVTEADAPAMASLHEETLRVTRLVEDLETLASADAAGFTLDPRRSELGALARGVAVELAGPFEAVGVELRIDTPAPVEADVDVVRFEQVLRNLLSNALKFTPQGGVVRLGVATEGSEAVVRVEDTGSGIPADEIPRVFDRFFRGRGARASGSGIGLTVAKDLVAAHGGRIEVRSRVGRGSEFAVRLPATDPQAASTPSSPILHTADR